LKKRWQLINGLHNLSALNANWNEHRLNVNGDNHDGNRNGYAFEMALASKTFLVMKTRKNLYPKIYDIKNLVLAWKRARKGKTKKEYVIEFEKNLGINLRALHNELKFQTYAPKQLRTFILRDPKTRKISKSDFRDRVIHHVLVNILEPIFDKTFIYDSCANRIGKGNLFAIKRFEKFQRKITKNLSSSGYCLKADIKHYFQEVNHETLLQIIKEKIIDEEVIFLIKKILENGVSANKKGMPLGNLTSQFFANIYLNELDYFVKHKLKAKYYIRYVDDFVILHSSKPKLEIWKEEIGEFLKEKLNLELHPDKSKITRLSKGIDFVGFRNFYHFKLLRKRNVRKMLFKIEEYNRDKLSKEKLLKGFQGWNAYAKWADSYNLILKMFDGIRRF
jgi:retron-type reverse transcriptase